MNNSRFRKTMLRFLMALALGAYWSGTAKGAGITIVTHGFQLTSLDHDHNWVESMGELIASKANGTPYVYRLVVSPTSFTTLTASLTAQNSGLPPLEQSQNAEIIIKLYWDQVAGVGPIPVDSTSVARIAYQSLKTLNHSCELPIQIIGHSRGASVASELARLMGQDGIWVHQLTTLDPHPISGIDASVQVWENVLFADNYYEEYLFTAPDGEPIDGAFNENLTDRLPGGYGDDSGPLFTYNNHSDVHLWYHGTIDTTSGASDGNQTFTDNMRNTWYLIPSEYAGEEAGFYYSRLGGGAWALDGFLDGYNNGGVNLFPDSRQPLPSRNANEWPSLVTVSQSSSGSVTAGNSFPVEFLYQSYEAGASVTAYLDTDQNPYNGNEIELTLPAINPQPSTGSTTKVIDVNATVPSSTPPGYYYVYAKITNPNGTRYLYAIDKIQVQVAANAVATITSVSPSTLPTSFSPQLITIYGSNFKPAGDANASTLTFHDPANNPYVRTPVFVSSSQLQYNITVQSATGTWSVSVLNAGQPASNVKTFQVNTPPPNTGSLTVNLSPTGAVSAGAQWRVDGGTYHNTGDTEPGLSVGSHTVSFKPVTGYTTPTDQTASITSGATTPASGTYTIVTASTYVLTLSQGGSTGDILPSPAGTWNGSAYVYNAGAVVQLTANPNIGYHFGGWGGALSGTANPTTITMDGNKTVSASFPSGDPNLGTVTVTIQPPAAAAAGVTWGWNASDFRASGSSYTTFPGGYWIVLHPVDGWLGPYSQSVTLTAGQTTSYTVTFTADTTPGLLTVTLSPPDAVTAGAKWHVNGGPAQGNGATASLAPGNNYTVSFDPVAGWTIPANIVVAVQRSQTTVVAGSYTPTAGKPVIGSISPPIAPMTGGTLMTITGVNFTAPASVLIADQPAGNVSVTSPTQITCRTPASSTYGSASVKVQTTSGTATNLNAFSYGMAKGSKLDIVSSIGGACYGVALQGNYAYIGEGRSLVVVDVSTPASPSRVGRVTLPGLVRGVALLGQYAYVADEEGGLQVVDITTPASPTIRGFYATTNDMWSAGISIFGGRAYVADESAGLQIFDLSNPIVPSLISSTNCGSAEAIAVKASTNGVFALVSTGNNLCVVDVSNPQSPLLKGQTSINGGVVYSIAVSGNYVYAASLSGKLEILDISNVNAPADVGHAPTGFGVYAVAVANNFVYTAGWDGGQSFVNTFFAFSISGNTLTLAGQTTGTSATGYNMLVSGNKAYIAGGASGMVIVDVSNSSNPSPVASFTDSGVFGAYQYPLGVSGNAVCAAVLPSNNRIKIFDCSQPANVTSVGQPNIAGTQIIAKNGIAYVLNGASNVIMNVSTPGSPQILKAFPNTANGGLRMALVGSTLYVVGQNGANQPYFVAIDISNPSSPTTSGTKSFPQFAAGSIAFSVAVNGTKAVIGIQPNSGPNQITLLDISNLNTPVEQGSLTNIGYPKDIRISPDAHFAFVIEGNTPSVLRVVDLSNPASLSIVTTLPLDVSTGTGLEIKGNELLATTFRGLYVFDITNPSQPVPTRSYSVISGVQGVSVNDSSNQDDFIYLADSNGGIVVMREQDIEAPNIYITNPTFSSVYTNNSSTMSLGGGSDDNVAVATITWSNDRGGGGQINAPFDNWFASGIPLFPGTNVLTITAFDAAGNTGTDSLAVIYPLGNQLQTITFPAIPDQTFGAQPFSLAAAASSGLPVTFNVISGPATLSSNLLTLTGAGPVAIAASQPGNPFFNAATPVTNIFNVSKADQSIIFGGLANKYITDPPFPIMATASSGLQVSFSVLSGPAILNGTNLSITGAGTVTVRASQSGNVNYNAAQNVDRGFVVSKLPQFITFGALSRQVLGSAPFPLSANASSALPVNFTVLSGPATVSGNILTITGAGLVVLRASQPGDTTYASAPNVDQTLVITPGNKIITDSKYLQSGAFTFRFYGDDGTNYVVETSVDLVNWQRLITNQVNSLGYLEFTDLDATNHLKHFYQALPLP